VEPALRGRLRHAPGLIVPAGERPFAVLGFRFGEAGITEIDVYMSPDLLRRLATSTFST
jgi:hypothetical protein